MTGNVKGKEAGRKRRRGLSEVVEVGGLSRV